MYKARQRGLKRIVAVKMISAAGHHGPADLASVYGEQGAAMARSDRDDEAEKALNQSLDYSRAVLAQPRGRDPTARDGWRQRVAGRHCLRAWQAARRRATLALGPRDPDRAGPARTPERAGTSIARPVLAHSGRRDEAMKNAEVLFKTNADRPAVLFPVARCFAACASGSTNDSLRPRAMALALDALGAAIRNGFRDPVAIRTDPDFTQLRSDPAFEKLVDGIKP